jgi:hypothetical protein
LPAGHSELNNLSTYLAERFRWTGQRADLDLAIARAEDAARLRA